MLKLYGHRPALYLLYQRARRREAAARNSVGQTAGAPVSIQEANLDGALAERSDVVISLFGKERSPEMLVEMGAALASDSKVQVVYLKEVPDQTALDALLVDDQAVISLNRRIEAMAEERSVDVDFDAAVTHDLVATVNAITQRTHDEGADAEGFADALDIGGAI